MTRFYLAMLLSLLVYTSRCQHLNAHSGTIKMALLSEKIAGWSLFAPEAAGVNEIMTVSLFYNNQLLLKESGLITSSTGHFTAEQIANGIVTSSSSFKEFKEVGGLPEGTYSILVTLINNGREFSFQKEIWYDAQNNRNLIQLLAPKNGSALATNQPTFNWVGASSHPSLKYSFRLLSDKNQGIPYYTKENLEEPLLFYTSELPTLQENKEGFWFVEMYYKGNLLARSAIWSFNTNKPVEPEVVFFRSYVDISEVTNGSDYTILQALKLKKIPIGSTENLILEIRDLKSDKIVYSDSLVKFERDAPYFVLDLYEENLIHKRKYKVLCTAGTVKKLFYITYYSPEFTN